MNGLDLFSGIGGLTIALDDYVRPIAYCEIDRYCQAVLLSRMANKQLPYAAIWNDICTLEAKNLPKIDLIYGGFPCQDISIAGIGKGLEGERSGLFFEMLRLCNEIKPRFIFIENVPAITTRGGIDVIKSIASMGYDCRWCIISAESVGALHKRKRWFCLCHANSKSVQQANTKTKSDTIEKKTWGRYTRFDWSHFSIDDWKKNLSKMDVCIDGIPYHVDRLRALGNAVVPQQARKAFKILMGLK